MSATANSEEKNSVTHTVKLVCQPCSALSGYFHKLDLFLKRNSANQHALTQGSQKLTEPVFLRFACILNFSFQKAGKLILFHEAEFDMKQFFSRQVHRAQQLTMGSPALSQNQREVK